MTCENLWHSVPGNNREHHVTVQCGNNLLNWPWPDGDGLQNKDMVGLSCAFTEPDLVQRHYQNLCQNWNSVVLTFSQDIHNVQRFVATVTFEQSSCKEPIESAQFLSIIFFLAKVNHILGQNTGMGKDLHKDGQCPRPNCTTAPYKKFQTASPSFDFHLRAWILAALWNMLSSPSRTHNLATKLRK